MKTLNERIVQGKRRVTVELEEGEKLIALNDDKLYMLGEPLGRPGAARSHAAGCRRSDLVLCRAENGESMTHPKIQFAKVTISYVSDDGFQSEETFSTSLNNKATAAGIIDQQKPEQPFVDGLEELARLTSLFGVDDMALAAFNGARERVAEWFKSKEVNE